jgi:hypothetical protein
VRSGAQSHRARYGYDSLRWRCVVASITDSGDASTPVTASYATLAAYLEEGDLFADNALNGGVVAGQPLPSATAPPSHAGTDLD